MMTDVAAAALALRIRSAWPTMKIPADQWAEAIVDLDHADADATFVDLRARLTTPPTIAAFLAAYHDRRTVMTPHTVTYGRAAARAIGFQEYLDGIARRSAAGDLEARHLLELWTSNLTGPLATSIVAGGTDDDQPTTTEEAAAP